MCETLSTQKPNPDGLYSLYQEDVITIAINAIDEIQSSMTNLKIDVCTDKSVDLIENDLYEMIENFIDKHYGNGHYRSYN